MAFDRLYVGFNEVDDLFTCPQAYLYRSKLSDHLKIWFRMPLETCKWWPETGSNRRRRPFQGRALPLSYLALAWKQQRMGRQVRLAFVRFESPAWRRDLTRDADAPGLRERRRSV
jgi:hypothetical protein